MAFISYKRRGRLCLSVAIGLLVSTSASGDEYHAVNAGAAVWDGAVLFTPAKAAAIAATGCRAVRINFRLDPQSGRSAWDAGLLAQYDAVVQTARAHNLTILGLLCNEAVAQGQDVYNDDADGDGTNAYVGNFGAAALLLVSRYQDNIKRWEIWNEPNAWTQPSYATDPRHAGGTYMLPRVYAHLFAETYKQLNYYAGRSVLDDHVISLCSGGLFAHEIGGGFSTAMDYMQQVYDQTAVWNGLQAATGRRYPWRFFGYHYYLATDTVITPSRLNQYFNAVRSAQSAAGDLSPILVTEFGWNSASAGGGAAGEANQRDNLRIAFNHMETRPFIVGAHWYQWVDEAYPWYWGLTRGDGSRKPAHEEFVLQNVDNLPPAEPRVAIEADATEVSAGRSVRITPTATFFTGVTALESAWMMDGLAQSAAGAPTERDIVFATPGEHTVQLIVTDSNRLVGRSNTLVIHVSAPAYSKADWDQDGDVDMSDFGRFQVCLSGGGVPQTDPACADARLDGDGDVDALDVARFESCFSGPGVTADAECGWPTER